MASRYFALIYGIVFILIGIAGFVPGLVTPTETGENVVAGTASGQLFGLFPINVLHNIVHLAFGVWGIIAYRSLSGTRRYFQVVAVVYAIFAVMGLIPGLSTVFGLVPLYGHDIWLHAILALGAAYFGFIHPRQHLVHTPSGDERRL